MGGPTGRIADFLAAAAAWARSQADLRSLALVGSCARGAASPSSDVDLIVLADDPEAYLRDTGWASMFGIVEKEQVEHYGRVTSLRVWYAGGLEVEFGFTTPDWAAEPLDEGTRKTIDEGLKVLWERTPFLTSLATKKRNYG
ncbi:MAG: nucleotidyltransferase domain-containing protein [Spirochaetales bacterium]|nr:nucleotidyltransferase domain-containing protein [Spirochaetales bacterium]